MDNTLGGFDDLRLERGGGFPMERLTEVGQSGVRVRPLGGNRAGEVRLGRFLRNERVTPKETIETAAARTASRVAGRHILVIQDTATLRDDGDLYSRNLHPSIAADAADAADGGSAGAVRRRTGRTGAAATGASRGTGGGSGRGFGRCAGSGTGESHTKK